MREVKSVTQCALNDLVMMKVFDAEKTRLLETVHLYGGRLEIVYDYTKNLGILTYIRKDEDK